jgi:hypothetical protein
MSPIKHLTTPLEDEYTTPLEDEYGVPLNLGDLDRDVPITNPSQMTWDRLEQLLVIISGSAVLGSAIAEQTPLGGINGAIIGVVLGTIWGWYITHKSLHE